MAECNVVHEPGRDTPIHTACDVLVVGGGPAGCAAAAAAAQMGADTLLVERYGILGGMSTGGLVVWIDRMSDWKGIQIVAGFGDELLGRLPADAILGPPKELAGSNEPEIVEYWRHRACAFRDTITWSPTVDPEMLKIAYFELLFEKKVRLLLHSWVVAPIMKENAIGGVIFESKSGRRAITAKVVIDATGDGDVFAMAGAQFESDIYENSIHHQINVAFLWTNIDFVRYLQFKLEHPEEFQCIADQAKADGMDVSAHVLPHADTCVFMGPRLPGYSCLCVEDLTEVEIQSRRRMKKMLEFFRSKIPGFEKARIMTTAPQVGVRHSRRLVGVKKMMQADWMSGRIHADEIGVVPPPEPEYTNVSIPLGCLIPKELDQLMAAGRNLSCDAVTHVFMREIPYCWVMGQASGVAAAIAANSGKSPGDVDISEVKRFLKAQGAWLR